MNSPSAKAAQTPGSQQKQSRAVNIAKVPTIPNVQNVQNVPNQPYQQLPTLMVPQLPPVTHSVEYVRQQPPPEYVRAMYPITAAQYGSHSLHDVVTNNLQPLVSQNFLEQHMPASEDFPRTTLSSLSRAALALKSGIREEMEWASKYLIKATYELADDFLLEKVGGLIETLLSLISRGITSLSDDSSVDVTNSSEHLTNGDSRPSKRLKLHPAYFERRKKCQIPKALEAALILRNLCLQPENAKFLLRLPILTDIISRGLQLPDVSESLEMKQYCIEICDAVPATLHVNSEDDPFYLILIRGLESDDRSMLLSSLRALSRLSVADEHNRLLQEIRPTTVTRLIRFLQLNDVELLHALTGFFFQFTTYKTNTAALVKNPEIATLMRRLLGLTMWNAQFAPRDIVISDAKSIEVAPVSPPPQEPPQLSEDIVRELLTFQEPERAIHWMRACFEEDKDQSVTQILLWQSYRALFTPYSLPTQNGSVQVSGKPLLQAADVIKMVSNAFAGATAMVTNHASEGQKFIIRGIKCRRYPIAPSGRKYALCQWVTDNSSASLCATPFATSKDMYAHVISKHVQGSEGSITCQWKGCVNPCSEEDSTRRRIAAHLKIHVSDHFDNKKSQRSSNGTKISVVNQITTRDDKGEPKGMALTASLCLRNIARANRNMFDIAGKSIAEHDLLLNITLNPVIAPQASEILSSLR